MRKLLFLAASVMAVGCGTVRVPVTVTRAPEINLTKYKQIAVGEVRGRAAEDIGGRLKQALVENQAFQVIDRQHLDSILQELKLSGSDLADTENRRKLGKLLTSAVLVFGKVGEDSYHDDVSSERCDEEKHDKQGKVISKEPHTCYTRTGKAVSRVSFDVVDVETGTLLKSKNYEHTAVAQTSQRDGQPSAVNENALENACRQSVVEQFMRSIAPYKVTVMAPFKTDGDLPMLEMATRLAKAGDWDGARKNTLDAVAQCDTHPEIDAGTCAKAHWDLGLVFEYTSEFDKAIEHVKKAFALSDDEDLLAEIKEIERLREDQRKLAGDAAPAPEAAQ